MALPANIQTAITRLNAANNNAYNASTNPSGLAQGGHRQNFIADLQAIALVGSFAADQAVATAADVVLTHADVVLTHQDAANTGLDRTATAQNVTTTATNVTLAQAWASKAFGQIVADGKYSAAHWAQVAQNLAAGFNIPAVSGADAGKYLRVKGDGTGYELGVVSFDAINTRVDNLTPKPGDVLRSYQPTQNAEWLAANGAVYLRTAHPLLAALISNKYADYQALANGANIDIAGAMAMPANLAASFANGKCFLTQRANGASTQPILWLSEDKGLTFRLQSSANALHGYQKVVYASNRYVMLPYTVYNPNTNTANSFKTSTDGKAWTDVPQGNFVNTTSVLQFATDGTTILAIVPNVDARVWRNQNGGQTAFSVLGAIGSSSLAKSISYGNGAFILLQSDGSIHRSVNGGDNWTLITNLSNFSVAPLSILYAGNGIWFASGISGSTQVFFRSIDNGLTWAVLARYSINDALDRPTNLQGYDAFFDGDRIILFGSGTMFFTQNGDEWLRSKYGIGTSIGAFDTDGLFVTSPNAVPTGVSGIFRANIGATNRATQFQLPNLIGAELRTFLRGG